MVCGVVGRRSSVGRWTRDTSSVSRSQLGRDQFWLIGERSAQIIVAENVFGQYHNGGKARFREVDRVVREIKC